MKFMLAHGHHAGPAQRPVAAGLFAAAIGVVPSLLLAFLMGSVEAVAASLGTALIPSALILVAIMFVGGVLYGLVFSRAAADPGGGWLFGLAWGYVLWMLGPATVMTLIAGGPVAKGHAGLALMGALMVFGLVMGIAYPWLSRRLQAKLRDLNGNGKHGSSAPSRFGGR